MGTVVTGFIDSPEGHRALDLAVEEARKRNTMLVVVHSMRGGTETPVEEIAQYDLALKRVEERLKTEGVNYDVVKYVRGRSPSQDIIAAAEESNADLIVIGYRKRSSVGKALLGSQAQEIMMGAPCPVLATMEP
jgi:nucleotide-binding universal stress UspA family protein